MAHIFEIVKNDCGIYQTLCFNFPVLVDGEKKNFLSNVHDALRIVLSNGV